jgi:D-alanyl-D-alanine carboxypeptidase (penicillin-binding protein 5/6)
MKKVMVALLLLSMMLNPAWAASKKVQSVQKQAALPEKQDPYKAFIVVEAVTGRVLEGENIHLRLPPASVAKLMLALLVVEKLETGQIKLEDRVNATADACRMGGSQVFLKQGESFSLEEMMQALLVASANDAAYAIGDFLCGSRESVVETMNLRAKELGMADSAFFSMHGLPPQKGQEPDLTSCQDLSVLSRMLLRHPKILEWTSIKTIPFRQGQFIMRNHNRLLNRFTGMDGLKTGYYREAGFCIAATARQNALRLIVVVMGSPTARIRDRIVEEKLKKWFALYEMAEVIKKGEIVEREIAVSGGKQKTLKGVTEQGFSYPVPREEKKMLQKEIILPEKISAGVSQGQKLGEIVIRFKNEPVGRVGVLSPIRIEKSGFFSGMFN